MHGKSNPLSEPLGPKFRFFGDNFLLKSENRCDGSIAMSVDREIFIRDF